MPRDTLLDFFADFSAIDEPFVIHDDGYRVRQASYRQVAAGARRFAARLVAAGVEPDDKVVIWSENRIEWVVALWGTLLARAVLVPVDFHSSAELVGRLTVRVNAKVVLVGSEVGPLTGVVAAIWPLVESAPVADQSMASADWPAVARPVEPASLAEIIFTSGATADPKGVLITHKNIVSNLVPIEREVQKYARYEWPFHPVRFLNLLPLSHMFGQSMATFVPPMIRATIVFSHGYSPDEILRQIRSRRLSVLVCVPKVLQVLREHLEHVLPETREPDPLAGKHFLHRWWRYRHVHRLVGWKFWCVICGAAPLDADLEGFWRKLGFLVVQGYGLTETAPIVTLNHPFKAAKGTVGTPIGGVTVKIADDGEILVKGDNVTTGYYDGGGSGDTSPTHADGWFHTGDIGALDPSGRLQIKGRKKEMIATAQGLKVFPEDVERALLAESGVTEAAVVGLPVGGEERVHAVLVLEPGRDPETILRAANGRLEAHQRVSSTSVWPGPALPRTDGTDKLKRQEIRRWVLGQTAPSRPALPETTLEAVIRRFAPNRPRQTDVTLDELGLSSLDRVELMMALEEAFHVTLDETAVKGETRIDELRRLVDPPRSAAVEHAAGRVPPAGSEARARVDGPIAFPLWNRWRTVWWLRRLSLPTWILPLGRIFMALEVRGLEHLNGAPSPALFASNHQSHLDLPAIMLALPARQRYWLATAMSKEFFTAHFNRREYGWTAWFTNSLNYYLACTFFNAFPFPQREAGARQTLRYIGDVASGGYSVLIFPEGRRTDMGGIGRFRPGIGMIASRLNLPVIPVRIDGLDKVLHQSMRWPKRGPVRVSFGAPLTLSGENYQDLADEVARAVQNL